jgi:hypothetical protein
MKKLFLIPALFISLAVFSQEGRKSPHDTVSSLDNNITVTYGRPYKKGRVVFGTLEKYGKVWRLGADEATTISFRKETQFGDTRVPAGTYTLFAIPEENSWTLILNSVLGQWGAFSYEKNKDKNVARFQVPTHYLDSAVEQLSIRFEEQQMVIEWDVVRVFVPFSY